MRYSYKTEQRQYTCLECGAKQYAIGNICFRCGAKERMYFRHICKKCGLVVEGDNVYIQNKETAVTSCKACKMESSRKAAAKAYHLRRLREGKL